MSDSKQHDAMDHLAKAYEVMLERVRETVEPAGQRTLETLQEALAQARERAVALNELSREEAERVSRYLERDVRDAADFLTDTGAEFRDWLRFEGQLINDRLFEMFRSVADQTSLALRGWAEQAREAQTYHADEVTGPGSLVCEQCGQVVHFRHVSRIPPCPNCHGTRFQRQRPSPETADSVDQGDVDGG